MANQTSIRTPIAAIAASMLVLLLAAGCASPKAKLPPRTGDPIVDGHNAIQHGPERDRVLWQYRTALAAMHRQDFGEARRLLDDALARLSGVMSYDKSARKSRRMFEAEARKTFIGEPYERVMAYYYRGIIYWHDGELDNARACFRSGQIYDSSSGELEYNSDYVLLDYLDGYATAKLGGDGKDAFERAVKTGKRTPPFYDTKANVMFFIDFGPSPRKVAGGEYGERLMFRPPRTTLQSARLKVGDQTIALPAYDDLFFQASTRGGRVMDHVLGNKAVFKAGTDAAGNAAIISGAILAGSHDHTASHVGFGLLAAGAAAKIISAATRPDADVRTWDNLPMFLTFAPVTLPPGDHEVAIEFINQTGQPDSRLTKTFNLHVPDQPGDRVVYISDQSLLP